MSNPYGPRPDDDPAGWAWPPAYGPVAQPGVPFPPAPPPVPPERPRRRRWAVLGGIGAAVVVVIAVVVAMVQYGGDKKLPPLPDAASPQTSTVHAATDCTHSVSSGQLPTTGMVSAGGLSFPQSVAPGWRPKAEHRVPNSIDAVSLDDTVARAEGSSWIGQVTVGVTNFDQSMTLDAQAKLMLTCVVASDLYEDSAPKVPAVSPKSGRIDGIPTSEIDVPVSVTYADPRVQGDDLLIILVGTSPSTYFLGSSPIGDQPRREVVQTAAEALHVAAD